MLKTNILQNVSQNFNKTAHRVGLIAISTALTLSVIEVPDEAKRAIMPPQMAMAFAHDDSSSHNNPVRREREETAPHHISYSEVQRTPSRSGRNT